MNYEALGKNTALQIPILSATGYSKQQFSIPLKEQVVGWGVKHARVSFLHVTLDNNKVCCLCTANHVIFNPYVDKMGLHIKIR